MSLDYCPFCNQEKKIVKSHIVPKFIFDWIKETSATSLMRERQNPNVPLQDGFKTPLLCNDCEQIMSKYENYFRNKIFKPVLEEGIRNIEYDVKLQLFMLTIAWKNTYLEYIDVKKKNNRSSIEEMGEALDHWKNCILDEFYDDIYEHYIIFPIEKDISFENFENKKSYFMYIKRAVDITVMQKPFDYSYCLIPQMILISCINPKSYQKFDSLKVLKYGNLIVKPSPFDKEFYEILVNNIYYYNKKEISEKQENKIKYRISSNKESKNSRTFSIFDDFY